MKKLLTILWGLSPLFLYPSTVSAHAFGKLYTLPVPFWLYLYGGAAALIVSFIIIGLFVNQSSKTVSYSSIHLAKLNLIATQKWFLACLKIFSLFLFFLTILTGLIGKNIPVLNFNMTFFWIIFILGFTYLTALAGNTWLIVNPWKILVEVFEKITRREVNGFVKYPKEQLGYYFALVIYFIFIYAELLAKTSPFSLSLLIIQYSIINFFGVFLIGKNNWFAYCEFFSVFFKLIGKVAPIEYKAGKIYLRPPFAGLIKEKAEHFSLLLFILFMLSSTAFDGFRETIIWYRLYWQNLSDTVPYQIFQIIGLLLSPFVFLVIYLVLISLAKFIVKSKSSLNELALQFAMTLIPITLVYNIAHYYTLLLTQGQSIISIISDPFALSWNLFNTADYTPNIGIVDANFVWHSQVAFILIGHITAVYLAHIVALKIFPSHKKALLSQFPMLILMVAYTMIGLWILSQPIASGV